MNKDGKDHVIETYKKTKELSEGESLKHSSTDRLRIKGPKMLWLLFFL